VIAQALSTLVSIGLPLCGRSNRTYAWNADHHTGQSADRFYIITKGQVRICPVARRP
jgi:hypothetical protein